MGKQTYFFIGQDRTPSDLVRTHLTKHPSLKQGLLDLLGEQSLEDAYNAFDASPDDETDRLKPTLHDYLINLNRDEYSNPPLGLEYSMSMTNRYIVGLELRDSTDNHRSEAGYTDIGSACYNVANMLNVVPSEIKVYAMVF